MGKFLFLEAVGQALDSAIAAIDPERAERRQMARLRTSFYEDGRTTRLTTVRRSSASGDATWDAGGRTLRERARWLDENHDIVVGILDVLVRNVIGSGIRVEPLAMQLDKKTLHKDLNDRLRELLRDFSRRPEVTWMHNIGSSERLAALHLFREGEAFGQMISGDAKFIDHGTQVPFSIELIEPDMIPETYNDIAKNIRQGIQRNQWGRPLAFYAYKQHPGDTLLTPFANANSYKKIPASNMLFLRLVRRFSQLRGVSVLHSVISRLGDIKSYEDYERAAAQVAAALTVFIARDVNTNCPQDIANPDTKLLRSLAPGMILEGRPGEKPEIIQSNRPANQILEYRRGQLRAVSGGTKTGYSSISKDYDGSYSAQRQELVEQQPEYIALRELFVHGWSQPVYERLVGTAELSQALKEFAGTYDPYLLTHAMYNGPAMVWIDPDKEMSAIEARLRLRMKSKRQSIREAGDDPRSVEAEIEQEESDGVGYTDPVAPAANGAKPDNGNGKDLENGGGEDGKKSESDAKRPVRSRTQRRR